MALLMKWRARMGKKVRGLKLIEIGALLQTGRSYSFYQILTV